MRFLIVSALVACVAAAPSHLVPFPAVAYHAVAIPAVVPTLSPGDIQAAAIDAQVKAADLAQAAADKAIAINEQNAENYNVKAVVNTNLAQEQAVDGVWAVEDKKWQALDALKTAEAQLDGAVASQAVQLAKSAVGAAPYVVAPVFPVVYPGIASPAIKSIATQPPVEEVKTVADVEASAKAEEGPAELEVGKVEGNTDSVAVEAKSASEAAESSAIQSAAKTSAVESDAQTSGVLGAGHISTIQGAIATKTNYPTIPLVGPAFLAHPQVPLVFAVASPSW
ncbi:cuticular protein hypothetical 3 precursor [Bombyx mori]|uniref:Putative cuticle protein n=1 Tax=Bombyx mori TaxID=7091 RepID=C0H6F9_BOMMO|nr:cuticular protein hypothetical 3 precursor [Bombyx mori]FAA00470.1 TPA: putative cuticle protein [Bombyx mori]